MLRSDVWGFDGFVVSDCDALSDGASHRYIVDKFDGKLTTQAPQQHVVKGAVLVAP